MEHNPILEVEEINSFYGYVQILSNVSLQLTKANIVLLLGRNGMGKSTTIHSIIGFCDTRSGKIRLKGIDIKNLPTYKRIQLGIGFVPQGRRIFPSLTCQDNLTFAYSWKAEDSNLRKNALDEIYGMFPILKRRSRIKAKFLSGGEQQMLAIARVLLMNPVVCLLDEPFEGLAPLVILDIANTINKLKTKGLSILLVNPNINLYSIEINDIYLMHKGEIVFHSAPSVLFNNKEVMHRYLGVVEAEY